MKLQRLSFVTLALLAGCGEGVLDVHEEPYVDHDLGEVRAGLTVGQAGGCDTSIVRGLTAQLFAELNCISPNSMTKFGGASYNLYSAVEPYLAPSAATALNTAVNASGTQITMSSAYRSVAQQYLLYRWWQAGQCNIQIAGVPGGSNHQSGRAIDVPAYSSWINRLGARGWKWYGSGDLVHFDYLSAPDRRSSSVLAFQRLWNKNHSTGKLAEDSLWGSSTASAMANTPATGFPVSGCQSTGTLKGVIHQNNNLANRVAGAVVTVAGHSKTTGSDGQYSFVLAPGTHTVSVSKSGYGSNQLTRSVIAGQTSWASMEINPVTATGTLKGKIYAYDPSAPADTSHGISGATVKVAGKTTLSDAAGGFVFVLAPGTYTVNASSAGRAPGSMVRTVTANATVSGSIGLAVSGGAQAPDVSITFPAADAILDVAVLTLQGTASEGAGSLASVRVKLNGGPAVVVPVAAGQFASEVKLAPGLNLIEVSATNASGLSAVATSKATFAAGVSGLVRSSDGPVGKALVELKDAGKVVGSARTDGAGAFAIELMQVPGDYALEVSAEGLVSSTEWVKVTDDERLQVSILLSKAEQLPSGVTFLDPADGATVAEEKVLVSGIVTGSAPVVVQVNGVEAELIGGGRFTASVPLGFGENLIVAVATSADGERRSGSITVYYPGDELISGEEDPAALRVAEGCSSAPGLALCAWVAVASLGVRRRRPPTSRA